MALLSGTYTPLQIKKGAIQLKMHLQLAMYIFNTALQFIKCWGPSFTPNPNGAFPQTGESGWMKPNRWVSVINCPVAQLPFEKCLALEKPKSCSVYWLSCTLVLSICIMRTSKASNNTSNRAWTQKQLHRTVYSSLLTALQDFSNMLLVCESESMCVFGCKTCA